MTSFLQDEFRSGGGGGGGGGGGRVALKSLARILFIHFYENQLVLPQYNLVFCSKMAI